MPIYRDGNAYGDTGGGTDITDAINRLVPKKRGKGRLPPAPTRDGLPASVGEAVPTASTPGGGIASPLVEISGERVLGTLQTITSSDGLFAFEYQPVIQAAFTDANTNRVDFEFLDE